MLQKLLTKHSDRHGAALQPAAIVLSGLKQELESHLLKEEMVLFPLIRQMEAAPHHSGVRNPIRVMLMEHDNAGAALARLRELTGGYVPPADACNTFRACYGELEALEKDLHLHIHLENNILFPRALELEAVAV
jgi:regulator of cell morphogenesis and NO signaling